MRLLIFIILLSILRVVGQTSEDHVIENLQRYMRSRPNWNSISKNTFTSSQNKLIESVINDSTNAFCDVWKTGGHYFENFHFLDLDGDKDLDLIFQGLECGGFESETVLIYLNVNGHYKKCLDKHGRISSITTNIDLIVYQYPCCVMIENNVINYKIQKDTLIESFGFTFFYNPIINKMTKDYDNMFPQNAKVDKQYSLKENTAIRYFPKDSLDQPTYIKKSLLGISNAQIFAVSYASYIDKSNIKWIYCKIPKEIVSGTNMKMSYSFLAWVKLEQ